LHQGVSRLWQYLSLQARTNVVRQCSDLVHCIRMLLDAVVASAAAIGSTNASFDQATLISWFVNRISDTGLLALHLAAALASDTHALQVTQLLVGYGADIHLISPSGMTAETIARTSGNGLCAETLMWMRAQGSHGATLPPSQQLALSQLQEPSAPPLYVPVQHINQSQLLQPSLPSTFQPQQPLHQQSLQAPTPGQPCPPPPPTPSQPVCLSQYGIPPSMQLQRLQRLPPPPPLQSPLLYPQQPPPPQPPPPPRPHPQALQPAGLQQMSQGVGYSSQLMATQQHQLSATQQATLPAIPQTPQMPPPTSSQLLV